MWCDPGVNCFVVPCEGVETAIIGFGQLVSGGENIQFFVVSELALLAWGVSDASEDPWRNWMPGASLPPIPEVGDDDSLYEWVEVEPEPVSVCTVFNTEAEAHSRGLNETELMHCVFEYGVPEGLRMASAESDCEDDSSSGACSEILFVVDQVAEPRVLCLDQLLPIDGDVQVLSNPGPAKIMRILFRGEEGLGG